VSIANSTRCLMSMKYKIPKGIIILRANTDRMQMDPEEFCTERASYFTENDVIEHDGKYCQRALTGCMVFKVPDKRYYWIAVPKESVEIADE